MDIVLRVLIVLIYAGLGVAIGSGYESSAEAVFWAGFLLVPLAGVLVFVWFFVGPLCTVRHAGLRYTIRAVLVAAYASIAFWGWITAGSRYAQEVATYDPSDECGNLAGSCVPEDGRVGWLILWALVGLVGVDAARRSARRLHAEDDGFSENADRLVGEVSR